MFKWFHKQARFIFLFPLPLMSGKLREQTAETFVKLLGEPQHLPGQVKSFLVKTEIYMRENPEQFWIIVGAVLLVLWFVLKWGRLYYYDEEGNPQYLCRIPIWMGGVLIIPDAVARNAETGRFYIKLPPLPPWRYRKRQLLVYAGHNKKAFSMNKVVHFDL